MLIENNGVNNTWGAEFFIHWLFKIIICVRGGKIYNCK